MTPKERNEAVCKAFAVDGVEMYHLVRDGRPIGPEWMTQKDAENMANNLRSIGGQYSGVIVEGGIEYPDISSTLGLAVLLIEAVHQPFHFDIDEEGTACARFGENKESCGKSLAEVICLAAMNARGHVNEHDLPKL